MTVDIKKKRSKGKQALIDLGQIVGKVIVLLLALVFVVAMAMAAILIGMMIIPMIGAGLSQTINPAEISAAPDLFVVWYLPLTFVAVMIGAIVLYALRGLWRVAYEHILDILVWIEGLD